MPIPETSNKIQPQIKSFPIKLNVKKLIIKVIKLISRQDQKNCPPHKYNFLETEDRWVEILVNGSIIPRSYLLLFQVKAKNLSHLELIFQKGFYLNKHFLLACWQENTFLLCASIDDLYW